LSDAYHIRGLKYLKGRPTPHPVRHPIEARVRAWHENKVGAKNGRKTKRGRDIKFIGGLTVAIRWPEFDFRAGVSRLQPYPRLAHASYSLRKATTPKEPGFR